jgi:hypothetical protein
MRSAMRQSKDCETGEREYSPMGAFAANARNRPSVSFSTMVEFAAKPIN